MNKGIFYGLAAFGTWGLFPIYWKALHHVPAAEVMAHRIIWSMIFLGAMLARNFSGPNLASGRVNLGKLRGLCCSALLIGTNWFAYIIGVTSGDVLATSLGYFITPLLNVLLGFIFLRERLRRLQAASVALAVVAVIYLTLNYGKPPWLPLTLACSFGLYGLLRKTSPVGSLAGLTIETAILSIPALAYLVYLEWCGTGHFLRIDARTDVLLVLSGFITAVPLLLFNMAARLLPLSTIGIMQYISPSGQFILAVFLFNENFSTAHLISFATIWAALCLYTADSLWHGLHSPAKHAAGQPAYPERSRSHEKEATT